ncbi:alpha/beta hydrolase family protein [Myroides indicus]|uniref:Dipeptidyl aminopeptidase/acylaminoacyl peptidase n=1 Tax=Myroides indicus TaxID=1323422 RepID=A0A4R7F668_9FLAO|nr:prolyl oligopeptidase family serine peptidase [Myroides indicus]TDS66223.1 dipeptidyl aminopeptidase/acylaminoacyl peptidase [Myroides indicus]
MKVLTYKYLITYLLVLFPLYSFAGEIKDSIRLDTRWNTLMPMTLSDDGKWLFYDQYYTNAPAQDKSWAINTQNGKQTELTGVRGSKILLNGDILPYVKGDTLVLKNLSNSAQSEYIPQIKKFEVFKHKNILALLNKQNQLRILKFSSNGYKVVLEIDGVEKFESNQISLNKGKKHYNNKHPLYILYQKDTSTKNLYSLNLESLQSEKLGEPGENTGALTWNNQRDVFAIKNIDNELMIVDLKNKSTKTVSLPEKNLERFTFKFYNNNDLYISYQYNSEQKIPESEYTDIWYGNSALLYPSNFQPKYNKVYQAFVFQYNTQKLVPLDKAQDIEYLPLDRPNYIISFNPFEFQDYTESSSKIRFVLEQIEPQQVITELSITPYRYFFFPSPDDNYLLYPTEDYEIWEIYDFRTGEKNTFRADVYPATRMQPIWSSDSRQVFFQRDHNLYVYDLQSKKFEQLTDFKPGTSIWITNTQNSQGYNAKNIEQSMPVIFTASQTEKGTREIYSYSKGKLKKLTNTTSKRIDTKMLDRLTSLDTQTLVYTEEDYNQPAEIKIYKHGKTKTLVKSDMPEELYNWRKRKVVQYTDKHGVTLNGVLFYPKDFNTSKKYPMITWIYEKQGNLRTVFDIPTYLLRSGYAGFNQSLFNESGYFVFYPDTYVSEEGTGLSSLECVTKGIDAITKEEPAIDKAKLGLIGHSFGGYQAGFIATQTKLFAAVVAGAGNHNLIASSYSYNYNLHKPNHCRVEGHQYYMENSYGENPDKYLSNSSILFAQQTYTPVLLWTGLKDIIVPWEQTRQFFVALKRYQKPVIALFYKEPEHSISSTLPKEQKDLANRVMDWFDYYLKNKKDILWIKKGIDYNEYSLKVL